MEKRLKSKIEEEMENNMDTTKKIVEGTVEQFLLTDLKMSKSALSLEHPDFSMFMKDDELHFNISKKLAEELYYLDFCNISDKEISYLSFIFSERVSNILTNTLKEVNYFCLKMKPEPNLNNPTPTPYGPEYIEDQLSLICYLAYTFFEKKYAKLKDIKEVDRLIPVEIFIEILNNMKKKPLLSFTDEKGNKFAGIFVHSKIKSNFFSSSIETSIKIISKTIEGYHYGKIFINSPLKRYVSKIEDLGLSVLNEEEIKQLTERGRKYAELTAKPNYLEYKGFAYSPNDFFGEKKLHINGRVMIDLNSMNIINPNINEYWYIGDVLNQYSNDNFKEVKEDELWMCSPVVYGFSFSSKNWICMNLDNFSSITFSDKVFESLKIKQAYKNMFKACLTNDMPSFDDIKGKGEGKIFLLYGGAGIGKTLTAESIAEYLKMPIYYVSVGELGITPKELEHNLSKIMEVTTRWNAIVLLDEVDVFAQERKEASIERAAMTAILLRLLERFDGIMFMTTNLKENLDSAFISRATLTLKYPDLTETIKKEIWESLLLKAKNKGIGIENKIFDNIDTLSSININGREIKNTVRLAYSMAKSENNVITFKTLKDILSL